MPVTEYIRHFGFQETPFARNHDPRWLYLSTQHKEAIIKLRWTIEENGGLALIRGEVGAGKSFLIEYLMTAWPAQYAWKCAKIQNTGTISTPRALLAEVVSAFGLEPSRSARDMQSRLESWLLQETYGSGATIVLFIDEAQSVDSRAMPVLRDLVNLETRERILLQIVLAAQLSIDKKLAHYPALASRVASVVTMEPLCPDDIDAMLLHRFRRAGCVDPISLLPLDAMRAIYDHSRGNPRDVIVLTEAAMKESFLRGCVRIEPEHVDFAAAELAVRTKRIAKAA